MTKSTESSHAFRAPSRYQKSCGRMDSVWPIQRPSYLITVFQKKKRDLHPLTLWNIHMRMAQSFCQWSQTCVMRKQKRMSPTCPTTIWSHLKLTSWNEELTQQMPADGHLMLSLRTICTLKWNLAMQRCT